MNMYVSMNTNMNTKMNNTNMNTNMKIKVNVNMNMNMNMNTSIGRFAVDREFVNIETSLVKKLRTLFPKPGMSRSPMTTMCEYCSESRLA